jgi:hypothetical protein
MPCVGEESTVELVVRWYGASNNVNRRGHCWDLLPGNNWWRFSVCSNEKQSAQISESIIITCSYDLQVFSKSNYESQPGVSSLTRDNSLLKVTSSEYPFFFQSVTTEFSEVAGAPTALAHKAVGSPFFCFGVGWLLQSVLTFVFWGMMKDPTVSFMTSGPRAYLRATVSVLLPPRSSCCFTCWSRLISECLAWTPTNVVIMSCRKGMVSHLLGGGGGGGGSKLL